MFNNSKYTKLYYSLIEKYKTDKSHETESHHILPKSCGGTNDSDNLVNIPCRVHFILHKLLVKMFDDPKLGHKMRYALWRMMNPQTNIHNRNYIVTSSDYKRQRDYVRQNMITKNPMKRPEVAIKFRRKRPEQSDVVRKRNEIYWSTRKNPILQKVCLTCNMGFETNVAKRICCSKSCSAKYNNSLRHLGNRVASTPSNLRQLVPLEQMYHHLRVL